MTVYPAGDDWRIRINGHEHGAPHVHVLFRDGSKVAVAIETGEILAGRVKPLRRLAPVLQHIADNAALYLDEYRRLNP